MANRHETNVNIPDECKECGKKLISGEKTSEDILGCLILCDLSENIIPFLPCSKIVPFGKAGGRIVGNVMSENSTKKTGGFVIKKQIARSSRKTAR